MKRSLAVRSAISAVVVTGLLAGMHHASADQVYWQDGSADWLNASNWLDQSHHTNQLPGSADTTYVTNGGTPQLAGSASINTLNVDSGSSLNLTAGSLSTSQNQNVGLSGTGSFNQSGGTNNVGKSLTLGTNAGSAGYYTLSSNAVLKTTILETIGSSGNGTFTQTGGSHSLGGTMTLAYNTGSNGTYNLQGGTLTLGTSSSPQGINIGSKGAGSFFLSGTATLTVYGGETFGGNSGAVGTFSQSGGTHVVHNLQVGGGNATGTYNLSDGSLACNGVLIGEGNNSTGNFTQTGGSHSVSGFLGIASNASSTGAYTLQGGTLTIGTPTSQAGTTGLLMGDYGTGYFNLAGTGALTVYGGETVGSASGASGYFTHSGGTNTTTTLCVADNAHALCTYAQSGGSVILSQNLQLGYRLGASGSYILSGGNLSVGGNETVGLSGNGTFTQSGNSTNTVAGNLILGGTSGLYHMQGGILNAGNMTIRNNGAFTAEGGSVIVSGNLTINAGGLLNGKGSLSANVSNAGLVSVGTTNPATLTLNGNYHQTGELDLDIDSSTFMDNLTVNGNVTLGGIIKVQFDDGYNPAAPGTYQLLHWTGAMTDNGAAFDFSLASLDDGLTWDTSHFFTDGTLRVVEPSSGVPEPTSLALFGLGIVSLLARRRTR